jgi:formimidoylglutamate deiminase
MKLFADNALLPGGWARDVGITVAPTGMITSVIEHATPDPDAERVRGFLVPGMPNLHSHAFQRAMAGFTEARTHPTDSFWTWRALMYEFAARVTPELMNHLAEHAYIEMLKGGFTAVAEFHYIHNDERGRRYADAAEMSRRVIAAAIDAGIAITHLPVLYTSGGFGGRAPEPAQARFVEPPDEFAKIVAALAASHGTAHDVRIGVGFHSLRAVEAHAIGITLDAVRRIDETAPVHIHVAEQLKEVADCIAWSGRRPVDWLLDNAPVDARWCLVHATHMESRESRRLAARGAVAGLCPTTEANLGDGIFPAAEYLGAGGRFGIGSDSHVSLGVIDELRLLEYGQRLAVQRRAVLATESEASPGQRLFVDAAAGGAQALGISAGRIANGFRADFVVLDPGQPAFWNKRPSQALDAWIFAGDVRCVRDVMVGGSWRVRDRRHPREEEAARRFRAAQAALLG